MSVILRTTTGFLALLLLAFSLALLWRGHNAPGGGFAGGMTAGAGLALYAFAHGAARASKLIVLDGRIYLGVGLLTAFVAGMIGPLNGRPFLTGIWIEAHVPLLGAIPLGTPLLFDVGVYLAVFGMAATVVIALEAD
jgi:multicomponent Na+:H+ antiporter subunit B